MFKDTGIQLNSRKSSNPRPDRIARKNVKAVTSFQAWVEVELVGDDQCYNTLRKVLSSIRDFDEQVTIDDLKEVYRETLNH